MAFKGFSIIACYLFFFAIAQATRNIPKFNKMSSFEFINNLKGCQKGTHSKDIHRLKNYLHKFGYLPLSPNDSDDGFDDALETAIKTYQNNFHLNSTGTIDDETVTKMMMPRCGVADITNGVNFMQARKEKHEHNSSTTFHTVAHYTFFEGSPRWPSSQTHLTYRFLPNVPSVVEGPVIAAFGQWASATFFTFSRVESSQTANLVIGWYSGDHGDRDPFTGPGGTLAHAFAPTNGRLHFDADENWSVEPRPNTIHYETVAAHEIGHLLGLHHSAVEDALMWPSIRPGQTKGLNADDINGIRALYNV